MLTKDFMPLLPSLLPFPKVNTRCINKREELLSTRNLINHPKKKNASFLFVFGLGPISQLKVQAMD